MDYRKAIRPADLARMEQNWIEQEPVKGTQKEKNFRPVVKVFNPCGPGTWLFTEKEPQSSLAFGLADLGQGTPELGYVCLEELFSVKLIAGLHMEQDIHWDADKTLSEYATEARQLGYIKA